jgi:hypothetical protein
VAYGKLPIRLALVFGIMVRSASFRPVHIRIHGGLKTSFRLTLRFDNILNSEVVYNLGCWLFKYVT